MTSGRRVMLVGAFVGGGVVVLIAALQYLIPSGTATVKLENQSDDTVMSGYIAVCEERQAFREVSPGATIRMKFDVPTDCDYSVRLEMKSGSVMETRLGYVTRARDYEDRIIVTRDRVLLGENRVIKRQNQRAP